MYVEDVKEEFYQFLSGKRIFVMVHYDIDSICTCKILQTLLQFSHTIYTLEVVTGLEDVRQAYINHATDCKYFVFINCCGTVDIVEFLEPEEDVTFFVLDSHRPTDLCNIFSNGQVRLLSTPEEDGNVPEFADVFREEDEDDEEDDSEDDDAQVPKRRRSNDDRVLPEERILKRRERRRWEENRNRILFEYSQFTYYNKASALFMYNLAWKLNRDDKDLLWLAIVALSEQMTFGKIENTAYVLEAGTLQAHATRLQNRSNDGDVKTSLKVHIERDLRLVLYRHWTVEASLKYSMHTACKLRLWSQRGDSRLHQLLADMGLPLAQSRQTYRTMELQLRNEFQAKLHELADKYELGDVLLTTFALQYGYGHKFLATDVVYAMNAILECQEKKTPKESFNQALQCLTRTKNEILYQGIERAKQVTQILFKTVQSALEMRQVVSAGPFFYYIIQDGCVDWHMYSQQHVLRLLAQFILCAYVSGSKNKKANAMPLLVSAPCDLTSGDCLIVGVPPLCENSPKNFFGKAFEQAADRTGCETYCDYFDTSYFRLPSKNRTRFIDALTALLS